MTGELSQSAGPASRGDPGCLETDSLLLSRLMSFKNVFAEASGIMFDHIPWHVVRYKSSQALTTVLSAKTPWGTRR